MFYGLLTDQHCCSAQHFIYFHREAERNKIKPLCSQLSATLIEGFHDTRTITAISFQIGDTNTKLASTFWYWTLGLRRHSRKKCPALPDTSCHRAHNIKTRAQWNQLIRRDQATAWFETSKPVCTCRNSYRSTGISTESQRNETSRNCNA